MPRYEKICRDIKLARARSGKPGELQIGSDKDYCWRKVERLLDDASELTRRSQEVSPELYGKIFGLYWEM